MQGRLGIFVAVAALLLAPAATAGDDEPTLTALSPIVVQGAAVADVLSGAFLLAGAEDSTLTLTLAGTTAHVTHVRIVKDCREVTTPLYTACMEVPSPDSAAEAHRDEYELDAPALAALSVPERPFEVVLANDPAEAEELDAGDDGTILARAVGAPFLAADEDEEIAAPWCGPWCWELVEDSSDEWYLEGEAWDVAADGFLRIVLVGPKVEVAGERDGEPFHETYETGEWTETREVAGQGVLRRNVHDFLVVEILDSDLSAEAAALGRAYGDLVVDAFGVTTLTDARGTLVVDGSRRELAGEDLTLTEDVTLVPVLAIDAGDGMRIVLQASTVSPLPPEEVQASAFPAGAAAVGAAAVGVAGLAAFVAWLWPYLKYLGTAAILPMYSRIGREEVLEHGKREEIFALIRTNPGIHAHEISSRAAVGWGTTVYHLRLLESHGLVVGKRNGRYKRFFAAAGGAARQGDAYAVLRNETAANLARHVLAHPGCIQKDVCDALKLAPSLVTWHMNRLEEADLVKKVRDGRTVRYYAGGGWTGLQIGFGPATPPAAALVDAGPN